MSKKKNNAKTSKTPTNRAPNKRARRAASAEPAETNDAVETTSPIEDVETTPAVAPVESDASQPVAEAAEDHAASDEGDEGDEGDDGDEHEDESDETTGAGPAAKTRPEIPKVGTVIKKLNRYGKVRCHCTVVEDGGIRYKGRIYKSLSGAAMAAAKDLGLENKTQNGFTFWGLTKPTRPITDPVAAVGKSWLRYQTIASAALKVASEETRKKVRAAIKQQGKALEALLAGAAE